MKHLGFSFRWLVPVAFATVVIAGLSGCAALFGGFGDGLGDSDSYTLTYDSNGADSGTVPAAAEHSADKQVTVAGNTGDLTQTGMAFDGWNTDPNGGAVAYAPDETLTMPDADVTLYAQWAPVYSVTYDGNGAETGQVPTDAGHHRSGDNVTVAGNTGDLTQTGMAFDGWNTDPNGGAVAYAPDETLTMPDADVTLYAQWSALPTYSVTYHGTDATGGAAPTDSGTYTEGTAVTISDGGTLVNGDNLLMGWTTASDGSGEFFAAGTEMTLPAHDVNLYAQWVALPQMIAVTGTTEYAAMTNYSTTISDYMLGVSEVTQGLYVAVTGENPSQYGAGQSNWDQHPADSINWYAAVAFCNRLSLIAGLSPVYTIAGSTNPDNWGPIPDTADDTWNAATADWSANGYRLPTEAEFVWAARNRKVSGSLLFAGDDGSDFDPHTAPDIDEYVWYFDNSNGTTHPVMLKNPNQLGFYDLNGNVTEWLWNYDPWDSDNKPSGDLEDYRGPTDGSMRKSGGGAFNNSLYTSDSPVLEGSSSSPGNVYSSYGFRIARYQSMEDYQ